MFCLGGACWKIGSLLTEVLAGLAESLSSAEEGRSTLITRWKSD